MIFFVIVTTLICLTNLSNNGGKEVFWLVQKSTWYPYLSSRGSSEPQAQWSPSLAAQPKLCCKYSPLPCFAWGIENLTLFVIFTHWRRSRTSKFSLMWESWKGSTDSSRSTTILLLIALINIFNYQRSNWGQFLERLGLSITCTTSFSRNQSFLKI